MRAVDVVKSKRDYLVEQKEEFQRVKDLKYPNKPNYAELSDYEKLELSYITRVLTNLMIQIGALNFVLNEDSDLRDATYIITSEERRGLSRERVLSKENKVGNLGYHLLQVAQETRDAFSDAVENKDINVYNKAVEIKDRYFEKVDGDYNFEGMVMALKIGGALDMLSELKKLNENGVNQNEN